MDESFLKDCVDKMKRGDLEMFNAFYEETKRSVFYNIYALSKNHETSEDILHDTYVKFLNDLPNIDTSKSIGGYLMVISRNLTLDYFKKYNRVINIEDENLIESEKEHHNIDHDILLERIKSILKDKEFEIFVLHVIDELTFEEIAKLRKRPLGTVLYQYNKAIKKVKEELSYVA